MATPAEEATAASSTPLGTTPEAAAEANRSREADSTPSPRVRNFHVFTPPKSVRERELEARRAQLEARLEATNRRLQFADSFMARLDARLERAYLEQDLKMISTEIKQLRMLGFFARPSVGSDGRPARAARPGNGDFPRFSPFLGSDGVPALDLLA
ncbi:MAG: hypothetical protein JSV16_17235 [Candidatus Hydrogenedentota bacterium]|nr:MAG: hypothetical protein JSV16_17235 [Candidatus Hydrogenedentota bacterium]